MSFVLLKKELRILLCRVDAKVATDEKEDTPTKIAVESGHTEIAVLLSEATGEEVPDKAKLQQLMNAMCILDNKEAKNEFSEILASLSPDVVSLLESWMYFWPILLTQVSSTAAFSYGRLVGSVLQGAVVDFKTDFIRLLLEHG